VVQCVFIAKISVDHVLSEYLGELFYDNDIEALEV
jgi:hypothetical protein